MTRYSQQELWGGVLYPPTLPGDERTHRQNKITENSKGLNQNVPATIPFEETEVQTIS